MPSNISLAHDRSVADPTAEAHEAKVAEELRVQFLELRRQAWGRFDVLKGRRGAFSEACLEQAFRKAKVDYDSGRFLVQRLGAERYHDLQLVVTLTQLRQELLDGIENPTAADKMLADTAVAAYRNFLRIQGWVGSLCLVTERELFGQEPVSESNGASAGERIEREMHQLEHTLMPLLDRAHRMLVRGLDRLEARRSRGGPQAQVSIGRAGHVNVGVWCGTVETDKCHLLAETGIRFGHVA
jgi:hypothetical protein